jgi:hypothetical protein
MIPSTSWISQLPSRLISNPAHMLRASGYKITFGDAELLAYFKEFLRPKLVEMLF